MQGVVYRCYASDGSLLYIGSTIGAAETRITAHRSVHRRTGRSSWVVDLASVEVDAYPRWQDAAVTGVDQATVVRDLTPRDANASRGPDVDPESDAPLAPVVGLDGKTYEPHRPRPAPPPLTDEQRAERGRVADAEAADEARTGHHRSLFRFVMAFGTGLNVTGYADDYRANPRAPAIDAADIDRALAALADIAKQWREP